MKFASIAVLCASVQALRLNRSDYHDGAPNTADKIWGHLDDEVVFHDSGVHFDKTGFAQKNVTANSTANLTSNATANISANATKNVSANVTANATRNATGVSDESYDTKFDNLKGSITTTHKNAEASRSNAVSAEGASNSWRGVKPQF